MFLNHGAMTPIRRAAGQAAGQRPRRARSSLHRHKEFRQSAPPPPLRGAPDEIPPAQHSRAMPHPPSEPDLPIIRPHPNRRCRTVPRPARSGYLAVGKGAEAATLSTPRRCSSAGRVALAIEIDIGLEVPANGPPRWLPVGARVPRRQAVGAKCSSRRRAGARRAAHGRHRPSRSGTHWSAGRERGGPRPTNSARMPCAACPSSRSRTIERGTVKIGGFRFWHGGAFGGATSGQPPQQVEQRQSVKRLGEMSIHACAARGSTCSGKADAVSATIGSPRTGHPAP